MLLNDTGQGADPRARRDAESAAVGTTAMVAKPIARRAPEGDQSDRRGRRRRAIPSRAKQSRRGRRRRRLRLKRMVVAAACNGHADESLS